VWAIGNAFPLYCDDTWNNPNPRKPVPKLLFTGIQRMSLSKYATGAVATHGGQFFCWGDGWSFIDKEDGGVRFGHPLLAQPQYIMDNVQDAYPGPKFNLARKTDGTLWVWYYSEGGAIIYPEQPILHKVIAFDSVENEAQESRTVAVTQDGNLWFWGSNTPITAKPKRLLRGIADCAVSHPFYDTTLALGRDGSLYHIWETAEGKAGFKRIARNVTRLKGGGIGPCCFTTRDGKLWAIIIRSNGDGPGGYFSLGGTTADFLPDARSAEFIRLVATDVADFYPGLNTIIIKKRDGRFYGSGLDIEFPLATQEDLQKNEYFRLLDLKLDSAGIKPLFDLEKAAGADAGSEGSSSGER
jgi:hypothetical protein